MHNEKKINLEVTCKRNRFGYWNSCKRLPNFVNVAALPGGVTYFTLAYIGKIIEKSSCLKP